MSYRRVFRQAAVGPPSKVIASRYRADYKIVQTDWITGLAGGFTRWDRQIPACPIGYNYSSYAWVFF